MSSLLDLFRLNNQALSYNDVAEPNRVPARLRDLPLPPSPPVKPEWDIRSGLPEPGLEQVTPEEWLPPGAGVKLAALAKGLVGKAAIAGTFIGPKHPAWMKNATNEALRLKNKGVDPRDIWARTRVFTEHPGVDAVQEISDARSVVNRGPMITPIRSSPNYSYTPELGVMAEDILQHPNLYRGYPDLGTHKVSAILDPSSDIHGAYYPSERKIFAVAPDTNKLRGVLTHELQHGAQRAEGWPVGGSAGTMMYDPQTRGYTINLAEEFERAGYDPLAAYKKASYEAYRRLAGEAQAEAARVRRNMTDYQLTQNYPGDSYPVPLKDLLIRR